VVPGQRIVNAHFRVIIRVLRVVFGANLDLSKHVVGLYQRRDKHRPSMLGELAQEKTLKLTVQFSKQFSADSGLESADSVDAGLASADSKFSTF